MLKQSFEEYLSDQCDCHTNNSPEGFENWLADLDGEEYMSYAQDYGQQCFQEGKQQELDKMNAVFIENFK